MVTLDVDAGLVALKPATRAKGVEGLDEKGIPVGDGAYKPAYVDIVDGAFIESPLL